MSKGFFALGRFYFFFGGLLLRISINSKPDPDPTNGSMQPVPGTMGRSTDKAISSIYKILTDMSMV